MFSLLTLSDTVTNGQFASNFFGQFDLSNLGSFLGDLMGLATKILGLITQIFG